MRSVLCGLAATVAAVGIGVGVAEAGPVYGFTNITNNASDVGGQLSVEVNDAGTLFGIQLVDFIFRNDGPTPSSITDVFFEDGTLLSIVQIIDGSGVNFSHIAIPFDLPGGNAVGFDGTAFFSADSDPPVQQNGVNTGEWLRIRFALLPGKSYQDTLDALALGLDQGRVNGSLRIGLHVQGLPGGGSDSYINGGTAIPLPSVAAMGLVGLAAVARRRRLD